MERTGIRVQDPLVPGQDPVRIVDPFLVFRDSFHLIGQHLSVPGRRQRPFRSIRDIHLLGVYCFLRRPMLDELKDVEVAEGLTQLDIDATFHNQAYCTTFDKRSVYRDWQVDQ